MDHQEENNYPKAFLATGIILAVMLLLCYFIIFKNPPVQDDGTGGMVVNYGTTDEGMGKDINSVEEPSVSPKANHVQPTKVTPAQPTEQKTQVDNSNTKVATQDLEDAPEVAPNSKKTTKTVATTPEKPVKKQVPIQAALFKHMHNDGSGAGDGTTTTPGNQGSRNGSTLSNNYGQGGSGNGLNMSGNWNLVDPPDVENAHNVPGVVVIDFTVDQNGNVIHAAYNARKTKAELNMIQSCEEAIRKCKFSSSTPVTGNHNGEYSFIFKVR